MNLPTGHHLQKGKYRLLHVVGQGGFGITYKGLLFTEVKGPLGALKTEIPISIKEYFFKDYCYRDPTTYNVYVHSETGKILFDKFREKLIKEAKILSDVHHPYIVNVLDVFEENNTAYIAMEYISGHSLKYVLEREGVLPEKRLLKYIGQVGRALQFVHEKNILHLDIKPSNILIDTDDKARLIDFGVSKRYDIEEQETSTTMLTVSKGFASVEQYDSEGTQVFSPRPDIYSLGATMYNLLTGKTPVESILRAARPLKKPSVFNPDITPETEKVILKAMEIVPEERYSSVSEMLEALGIGEEEEEKEAISRQDNTGDGETTVLHLPSRLVKEEDGDEHTILNDVDDSWGDGRREKREKKRIILISLLGVFALIGSSLALLLTYDKAALTDGESPLVFPEKQDGEKELVSDYPDQRISEKSSIFSDNIVEETSNPVTGELDSSEFVPAETNQPAAGPEIDDGQMADPPGPLLPVETDRRYAELVSSGKAKMQLNDFEGANKDFIEAYRAKPTNEAIELVRKSSRKLEDKLTAEKLAMYEEKSIFGKLMIVRKKATGRYGAIDDKGNEVIVCEYKYAEKIDEEYAFVREDGLLDIYNLEGKLLKSAATY